MIRRVASEIRHLRGWSTPSPLVVLNVDDYGTIRVANRAARDVLEAAIPGYGGQMDTLDALETREDLEALFEVLDSVRDGAGRPPVFTAYALSANPSLAHMQRERRYAYEPVPETFARLSAEQPAAYEGAWGLWKEGMEAGLLRPQFHGREHMNVRLLEIKLQRNDSDLQANMAVGSMAGLRPVADMPGVGFTQSFGIHDVAYLAQHRQIIEDGLRLFEQVYGFPSTTFTPPAQQLHPSLDAFVHQLGIQAIDKPFFHRRALGNGSRQLCINFLRAPSAHRAGAVVRTLSFEPTSGSRSDPVGHALKQIETAFRWNKPAIVSSHRVNYAGHIEPGNRRAGLKSLKELLQAIVKRWPDVQFITADELVRRMQGAMR